MKTKVKKSLKVTYLDPWELRQRAKKYYPNSHVMRRQWMAQTWELYATGKHRLQLGTVQKVG